MLSLKKSNLKAIMCVCVCVYVCVCVCMCVASIRTFDDKALMYSNLKTNEPKETYQGAASMQIY